MSCVYIVRAYGRGIKVGYTTNINRRFREIQTHIPEKLKAVCIITNGTPKMEKELHRLFRGERTRGEWYHYKGIVRNAITAIREHNGQLRKYHDFKNKCVTYHLRSVKTLARLAQAQYLKTMFASKRRDAMKKGRKFQNEKHKRQERIIRAAQDGHYLYIPDTWPEEYYN